MILARNTVSLAVPLVVLLMLGTAAWAQDPSKPVYRCPGNPVLYTDTMSAKEAIEKGCRTLEGAPITVIQGNRPRTGATPPTSSTARSPEARVDPNDQRARDADARRILDAELKKEEDRLAELKKEYNGGEPERRGDERNYQKYIDRTAELKAALARKESDVAAIKREIGKLR
jgi:hypothetical protein